MRPNPAIAAVLLFVLGLDGCSAMREIPPGDLAELPEQRDVRVELRSGQVFEFDQARFGPDSLWGYQRTEQDGDIPESSTTPLALVDVTRVTARRLDWYRTSLAAAAALGAGVAFAISQRKSTSSGGDGGAVKPPPTPAGGAAR